MTPALRLAEFEDAAASSHGFARIEAGVTSEVLRAHHFVEASAGLDQALSPLDALRRTAELARGVAGINTLLTTPTQGKPFDPVYFGAWFAEAIDKAGLPDDCVTHGLRKCASGTLRKSDAAKTKSRR